MDKKAQDNRTNQCNPNRIPTDPCRNAGFQGPKAAAAVDNRAN